VHTGDSITVAPSQTLSDFEYQAMRDAAIKVIREIGVETGGSNIQFAINPKNGRMVVIEMNPRVSRSSALASKATGFPIAKIAAKLAVGYALDEIFNDITKETPASFEPTIDYCVVKIPRFTFEKFNGAKDELGISMQSVGETMALGRNFKEAFQKGMRSLETGCSGFILDKKEKEFAAISDEDLIKLVARPSSERFFHIRNAFKRGWTLEKIQELTMIDKWFLAQFRDIIKMENEIIAKGIGDLDFFRKIKQNGFSDKQIGDLIGETEDEVRKKREAKNLMPVYKLVDTCAAEFEAYTPYYYSSYDVEDEGV
jgi:carbamoyl-phosphate synthase large subunit